MLFLIAFNKPCWGKLVQQNWAPQNKKTLFITSIPVSWVIPKNIPYPSHKDVENIPFPFPDILQNIDTHPLWTSRFKITPAYLDIHNSFILGLYRLIYILLVKSLNSFLQTQDEKSYLHS